MTGVLFELNPKTRKWVVQVTDSPTKQEALKAFTSVVKSVQQLDPNMLPLATVRDDMTIVPIVPLSLTAGS
jgi:septal ring-binding cell division protein DamX